MARIGCAIVTAALLWLVLAPRTAPIALAQDACPEPNDEFEAACSLQTDTPAVGYIASAADVDAYRFDSLDFDGIAHIELDDSPAPYKFALANWNGEQIALSQGTDGQESVDVPLHLPGSYYVFVQSPSGQFSIEQPYELSVHMMYPSNPPTVLYRQDFRDGSAQLPKTANGVVASGDQGRLAFTFGAPASEDKPVYGPWIPTVQAADFTLIFDTRREGGSRVFHLVAFGGQGTSAEGNAMEDQLWIGDHCGCVYLEHWEMGKLTDLIQAQHHPEIDINGGVNRNILRFVNGEVVLNVNGTELIRVPNVMRNMSTITLGARNVGDPVTLRFDNVLVTAASGQ